jgi:hypothetical protein
MTTRNIWSTEDFESLSWHDVHVHGVRFASFNESEGTANLVLDIDYILEWEQEGEVFVFTVCPAELTFHNAFGFKFALDYATPTTGMCPFSIQDISRVPLEFATGYKSFRWVIPINCPHGSLEFEAPAFKLRLVGKPVVQASQYLLPEQRDPALTGEDEAAADEVREEMRRARDWLVKPVNLARADHKSSSE